MSIAASAAVLGHLANLGQFVELGQGHVHQREQIRWIRRAYQLDAQSLRIDLLVVARDDVRGTYDTYVSRLHTLLLLSALIFPFALSTLQFSDEFVPRTEIQCSDCLEAALSWLGYIWGVMVAALLFLPFWSILFLLKSKSYLDSWLEFTLNRLHRERRSIIAEQLASTQDNQQTKRGDLIAGDAAHEETGRHMLRLSLFLVESQESFFELWSVHVCPLVKYSNILLWISIYVAVALVALMFWIFLFNRKGNQQAEHMLFGLLVIVGLLAPMFWLTRERLQGHAVQSNLDQDLIPRAVAALRTSGSPPTSQQRPPSQVHESNPSSQFASSSQSPRGYERPHSRGQTRWMTVRQAVRAGAVRSDTQQGLPPQTSQSMTNETTTQGGSIDLELDAPRRVLSRKSNRHVAQ